ncbi:MAG: sigma-70 family RNA polymerase sigma factor [Phycisphaeraceae bacterium]
MTRFVSKPFAEFARQLTFAPPKRRRSHLDRTEMLYWEVEPERDYPLDFVVYRITRYRPDTFELSTMTGHDLRQDLLTLADKLSASLDEHVSDYEPPPLSLEQLQRQLNVTSKTIQRYRKQGLFGRRLIYENNRRRLAFLPDSVAQFLAHRGGTRHDARPFSRIDEPTQHAIITRARRLIARRPEMTPFQAARHLAPKFERSTEAVRQLLLRHDKHDPRVAIFPRHVPPLSEKQQRVIHRAYQRGIGAGELAKRFGKSRNSIYRAVHRRRAAAIQNLPLSYITSPTFDLPDAAQIILNATPHHAPSTTSQPDDDAGNGHRERGERHSAAFERALFVQYNYLKYRAAGLRDQLDPSEPNARDLDQIETWLRRALATKLRLLRANQKLVISVARKHLATRSEELGPSLDELLAEGNAVLAEAVDSYDPAGRNRFEAYLGWTLMRRFATFTRTTHRPTRPIPPAQTFERATAAYWPGALNSATPAELTHLLTTLTDRERFVLTRHLGLGEEYHLDPQPLAAIAAELELTVERAQRLEHRALAKVRRTAAAKHQAHPPSRDGTGDAGLSSTPKGVGDDH